MSRLAKQIGLYRGKIEMCEKLRQTVLKKKKKSAEPLSSVLSVFISYCFNCISSLLMHVLGTW